jgi:hypothetical protein
MSDAPTVSPNRLESSEDSIRATVAGVSMSIDKQTAIAAGGRLASVHPGYWIAAATIGLAVYVVERAFPYHIGLAVESVMVPINEQGERQRVQGEKLDRTVEKLVEVTGDLKDQVKELRAEERERRAPIPVGPVVGGS